MLDSDAWSKGGTLTAPPLNGYDMYFDEGEEGEYGNNHLKQKSVVVNPGKMMLHLYKAKAFGCKSSYGCVELLAKSDHDLVMYWPNDGFGDQYKNFRSICQTKYISADLASIAAELSTISE